MSELRGEIYGEIYGEICSTVRNQRGKEQMSVRHRGRGGYLVMAVTLACIVALSACNAGGQTAKKAKPIVVGCTDAAITTLSAPQDDLARLACQSAGNQVLSVQTIYSAHDATVKVTVTVGGAVPLTKQQIGEAEKMTKSICRQEQQAMWASGVSLKHVTITVMGPTQDEYADIVAQVYGSVRLDAPTATHFDWANLSADSAWDRYDAVYLRPTFDVVDDVPTAP
jgi:hypothetical protein